MLPPEINSGRMYSGPGSGPMLAAAEAWDGLAVELRSTAAAYSSVVSGLTWEWRGTASAMMAAAASPYAAWITVTAEQAEQTATQARLAAAAFESAFAETLPPQVITANRFQLMSLIATNFFGQNTPAIMATQAAYMEMWAQDAAAMYGYACSSANATELTQFGPPPQTTNRAGMAGQAGAVAAAVATTSEPTKALPALMSAVPGALQSLAAPASSAVPAAAADSSAPASLASSLNSIVSFATGPLSPLSYFTVAGVPQLLGVQSYLLPQAGANLASAAGKVTASSGATSGAVLVSDSSVRTLGAGSAGIGRAGLIGGLSVPAGWATSAPAVKSAATLLAASGPPGGTAAVGTPAEGSLVGNMALSSLAGRAAVGTGASSGRAASAGGTAAGEASGPVNIFIVPRGAK